LLDERDSLKKEKKRLEDSLQKHDVNTAEVVKLLEEDAQKAHLDYTHLYHTLDQEGKKVVILPFRNINQ